MQNLLNNTNETWIMVITIIAVITIILWIFLPWVVMRIEGKVTKSTQLLQDMRDTLKDIKWELETHRPVDIELTEVDRLT